MREGCEDRKWIALSTQKRKEGEEGFYCITAAF
jgi:hypothetical protein